MHSLSFTGFNIVFYLIWIPSSTCSHCSSAALMYVYVCMCVLLAGPSCCSLCRSYIWWSCCGDRRCVYRSRYACSSNGVFCCYGYVDSVAVSDVATVRWVLIIVIIIGVASEASKTLYSGVELRIKQDTIQWCRIQNQGYMWGRTYVILYFDLS